jgi:hypothetical protein
MKKITFFLSIVLLSLAFAMGLIVGRASMPQYDMPEEFNTETISKDTLNPTQLMVIYDDKSGKYLFEFMDQ